MSGSFLTPIVHFPNAQDSFQCPQVAGTKNAFLGDIYGTYVYENYIFKPKI